MTEGRAKPMTRRWVDPGPRPTPSELGKVEDRPLPVRRLAEIWRGLPEEERLGFILSLEESLSYEVIQLTYETRERDVDHSR